jgi:hypothetical protein
MKKGNWTVTGLRRNVAWGCGFGFDGQLAPGAGHSLLTSFRDAGIPELDGSFFRAVSAQTEHELRENRVSATLLLYGRGGGDEMGPDNPAIDPKELTAFLRSVDVRQIRDGSGDGPLVGGEIVQGGNYSLADDGAIVSVEVHAGSIRGVIVEAELATPIEWGIIEAEFRTFATRAGLTVSSP